VNPQVMASRGCILLTLFFGGAERTATESGVFLTIEMSDQFWRLSLPAGADRDHPTANLFGPGSPSLEPVALPPVLVVVAGSDLLRDRVLGYAECLKAMGKAVELADFVAEEHGFIVLQPWGEAATELIRVMRRFVHSGVNTS
jgi:acetyl esterase/lipase